MSRVVALGRCEPPHTVGMPAAPDPDQLTPQERLSEVTRLLGEGARRLLAERRLQHQAEADQTEPTRAEASSKS